MATLIGFLFIIFSILIFIGVCWLAYWFIIGVLIGTGIKFIMNLLKKD